MAKKAKITKVPVDVKREFVLLNVFRDADENIGMSLMDEYGDDLFEYRELTTQLGQALSWYNMTVEQLDIEALYGLTVKLAELRFQEHADKSGTDKYEAQILETYAELEKSAVYQFLVEMAENLCVYDKYLGAFCSPLLGLDTEPETYYELEAHTWVLALNQSEAFKAYAPEAYAAAQFQLELGNRALAIQCARAAHADAIPLERHPKELFELDTDSLLDLTYLPSQLFKPHEHPDYATREMLSMLREQNQLLMAIASQQGIKLPEGLGAAI